ncbi:MAG TPA: diacylglycerol kinase family protein [Acidimicrobiales bacterium]|nr:diacylglycerol kinase family protein [Acidimicrobiales bacterium]
MPRPTVLERVAAVIALVSLAMVVAVAVVGALSNVQQMLATLLGLIMAVIGGWYVVARSGATRGVALIVAGGGVLVLVTALLTTDLSARRVVVGLAIAALSIAAARHALRRTPRAARQIVEGRTPVPPAQRGVLLINPKSGGGKAEKFNLVECCRDRGIEPIVLDKGDDLLELAEQAIADGADVIGMAGGDGSQALVATVAIRHDIPHVVVPSGTRNHFALDLGLDREDVVGALDAYDDALEHRVDLATVNDRVFVNNASVGLYAKIVQDPDYRDAKISTTAQKLPEMLGPDAEPLDLRFTGPDGIERPTAQVIMVSNDPYDLHRIVGRGTRQRIDLGVLGIVAAQIESAGDLSRFLALEATGRADRFPGFHEWTAPTFRIDSSGPVEIGVDGEALKLDPPLLFETKPRVLRIRMPCQAIGLSPTARAIHLLDRSTIVQLARVAVAAQTDE